MVLRMLLLWFVAVAMPAFAQEWTAAPPRVVEGPELPPVPEGWTTVPGPFLRVHAPDTEVDVALRMARHGAEALPRLADELEVAIGDTIHVYVTPTADTFHTLQPGVPPDWADATAWPELGAIFLRAPGLRVGGDEPLEQVLDHELTHVLLGRAFAPKEPPVWLQEGVAQVLAHQVGPDTGRTLAKGAAAGTIGPLEGIENGFPVAPTKARLAYAQSADFVAFLVDQGGPDVLPELVRASAGGAPMSAAVYRATGRFLEDVEADWRSRHGRASLGLAALSDLNWLWALGAVALVGAGIRRRRRFKRRLAEMEREEALYDAWLAELAARRAAALGGGYLGPSEAGWAGGGSAGSATPG
jgi:hypothetical protein